MGRPRKPSALKILEGDRKDRIHGDEPASPNGIGPPPVVLDDLAVEMWAEMSARLAEMQVGARADASEVMLLCQAYSDWRRFRAQIGELGELVECRTEQKTKHGSTVRSVWKAHPLLPAVMELQRQMHRSLGKLGMTPSDRAGLHVESKADDDPLVAYFAGSLHAKKAGQTQG